MRVIRQTCTDGSSRFAAHRVEGMKKRRTFNRMRRFDFQAVAGARTKDLFNARTMVCGNSMGIK
jgi:hypothetical protein